MVKSLLIKNSAAKIFKSAGRFLSLILIVLIGTGFYAGIQAASPAIYGSADKYYKDLQLADFKAVSADGFTAEQTKEMAALYSAETEGAYSFDFLSGGKTLRAHSITQKLNTVLAVSGTMPDKAGECAADSSFSLGDKITIDSTFLSETEFTVTAIIKSPLYLSQEYGQSSVGNGKLKSFVYLPKETFISPVFTEIYLSCPILKDKTAYSDAYAETSSQIYATITGSQNFSQFNAVLYDRDFAAGYADIDAVASVINSVSGLLPIFFIALATLMTSNSLMRMIAEQREEIGTLLSLGYGARNITASYFAYVLSAAGIGAAAGYFAGCAFIPGMIMSTTVFTIPQVSFGYSPLIFAIILLSALAVMSAVTFLSCRKLLKKNPAELMRPPMPKTGGNTLFEKTRIWNKLSFSRKVTLRNIFRFKLRSFMTFAGVASCTAFLLVGFGIGNSINGTASAQYENIFRYEASAVLSVQAEGKYDTSVSEIFESGTLTKPLLLRQDSVKYFADSRLRGAYIVCPENLSLFDEYYNISPCALSSFDYGAIITSNMAKVTGLKAGDTAEITLSDGKAVSITVSGISENYVYDFIYVSADYYENQISKPLYNTLVYGETDDAQETASYLKDKDFIYSVSLSKDSAQELKNSYKNMNGVIWLIIGVSAALAAVVLYNLCAINISERQREIATLKVLGFTDKESDSFVYKEVYIMAFLGIAAGLVTGYFLHALILGAIKLDTLIFLNKIDVISYVFSAAISAAVTVIMNVVTYAKIRTVDMLGSLKSVE